MTATKMNAQEIIQFIANAEKKTSVKVTFEGQLTGSIPASVTKLGNVLFGDWKDISPLLEGLTENKDYVVEQDARNSAVPLLDKRDINARIEPGAIIRDQVMDQLSYGHLVPQHSPCFQSNSQEVVRYLSSLRKERYQV